MTAALRPISMSDQRHPCSYVTDDAICPTRAKFRIRPSCSHTEEEWPTAQACTKHLAAVVTMASARCTGHMTGETVRVRPW